MRSSSFFNWSVFFGTLALAIGAIALAIPSATETLFYDFSATPDRSQETPSNVTSLSGSTVGSYDGMANLSMLNNAYRDRFPPRIAEHLQKASGNVRSPAVMGTATDSLSGSGAHSYLGLFIVQAASEVPFVHEKGNVETEMSRIEPMFLLLLGLGLTGLAVWAWTSRKREGRKGSTPHHQ